MTKVSVIVPIYNVEDYIKQCLDSILNQTLDDFEVICVDDCGADNSVEIAEDYAKKDNRIKLIHGSVNRGLAYSRNVGMRHASGEYIFFLDSDDYFNNYEILENLYNDAKKYKTDIVISKTFVYTDENSNKLKKYTKNLEQWFECRYSGLYSVDTYNFSDAINYIPCVAWGKLFKKSFLSDNNLEFIKDNVIHEDDGFWIKVCSCAPLIYFSENFGIMYRIRKNAITTCKKAKKRKFKNMHRSLEDAMAFTDKINSVYRKIVINSKRYSKYFVSKFGFLYRFKWLKNDKCIEILSLPIYREKILNNVHKFIKVFGFRVAKKLIEPVELYPENDDYDVFITVHDQDLILKLEQNNSFANLRDYRYLFLGQRPTDKLKECKHQVIVARDLPINIENYKSLLDYTGWYAVSKNNISQKKNICFLQYDYYVHKDFDQVLGKYYRAYPNGVFAFLPCNCSSNDFYSGEFSDGIRLACKEFKGINIEDEIEKQVKYGVMIVPYGNSFATSKEVLDKYITWMEPMHDYISKDEKAGHSIERSMGYFCLLNRINTYKLPHVADHLYGNAHTQSYGQFGDKNLLNLFINGKLRG